MNVVAGVEEEALKVMVEQLCDPGSLVAMSPSNRRYRTNPAETQVLSEIDQEEMRQMRHAMHQGITGVLHQAEEMLASIDERELADAMEDALDRVQHSLTELSTKLSKTQEDQTEIKRLTASAKRVGKRHEEWLQQARPQLENGTVGSPGAVYVNEADELVIQAQGDELLAQMKDVNEEDVTKFLSFAQQVVIETQAALAEVTREEIELASELSTAAAQVLCKAAKVISDNLLGDDRAPVQRSEQSSRIQIEEIVEDEPEQTGRAKRHKKKMKKGTAASGQTQRPSLVPEAGVVQRELSKELSELLVYVKRHPGFAFLLGVLGLPFAWLLLPASSMVAVALMAEKVAPEYVSLAWAAVADLLKAAKLSFFVTRVSLKFSFRLLLRRVRSLSAMLKVRVQEKGVLQASVDGVKESALIVWDLSVMTYQGVRQFISLMASARADLDNSS